MKIKFKIVVLTIFLWIVGLCYKAYAIETMLKVAIESNLPPYQFLENGKPVGVHIDILNTIAKEYNFIIEYEQMETSTKCMDALENGEVDIVLGIAVNKELRYDVRYSESVSQSYICIVTSRDKAKDIQNDISTGNFLAAIEDNTVKYSYISNLRNLRYAVTSNQVKAFELMISKKADLLVGVKHSILYQLKKQHLEDQYVVINNYIVPIEYTAAVKQGNTELLKKINDGLQQIRINGEYEKIHDKWIDEEQYANKMLIKNIVTILLIIGFIIIVIFIFNFRLNFLLKRQVAIKTEELSKTNKNLEIQVIRTRNSSEMQNHVVENSLNGIVVFDKGGIITLFNHSACRILGLDIIPLGESIFEIELINTILHEKKDDILIGGKIFKSEEITIKFDGFHDTTYRYSIYQLYDFNKNIRGAILTIDDITEEIKIKAQIYEKEKNRTLNQIIAGIAHEVRNPLMSIKTFAEMIIIKRDNKDFQDTMHDIVPKEVDRISNLIKNLIDYAKPDSGNRDIVDLSDIIKSSTPLVEHMLNNNKIILNVNMEDELFINADKNQLIQVILNVVLNGFESMMLIKSHNENLYIDIMAWKDDCNVFVQLTDDGVGMTAEEIKKATEPFFTTKPTGTGLGLYITKQYVEGNGGTLDIESEKGVYTKVILKFGRIG